MKKNILFLLPILCFFLFPGYVDAAAKPWVAATPNEFTPLTWAKAHGVSSFFKAQKNNGYLDYLTVIYLPYAQIKLIASSTPQINWGEARSPFDVPGQSYVTNWAFPKMVTEEAKRQNPGAQFVWNMPYFNVNGPTADLSLSLKSTAGPQPYITSGSRPENDVAQERRMLIIDNEKSTATISAFDADTFLKNGDQAVEAFSPAVTIKNEDAIIARLFVGVRAQGKELVIYCSRGATITEASNALMAAGVPFDHQLQVDGGASATCAYNMPGQYFVEPGRTLPVLMGAYPIVLRGTIINAGVNVRVGPGTNHKSVAKLAKGTPVTAYEEKSGWVRIDQAQQQWVLKTLIKQN